MIQPKFNAGDQVLVHGRIVDVEEYGTFLVHVDGKTVAISFNPKVLSHHTPPFLIDGRTYQCREKKTTAIVSKNEYGWWIASFSDGHRASVSEKGFYVNDQETIYDLISIIPEQKRCECCGHILEKQS